MLVQEHNTLKYNISNEMNLKKESFRIVAFIAITRVLILSGIYLMKNLFWT